MKQGKAFADRNLFKRPGNMHIIAKLYYFELRF